MGTRKPSSLRAKKKKGFIEVATKDLRSFDAFANIVNIGLFSWMST
jgi:hypothetical protein